VFFAGLVRYDSKCAVVIGGSNGIGLATAKLLTDLGVRVLVTGHSPTSIENARATLGKTAVVVESDATSHADLQNLAKTKSSLGRIDLLFVNAGMTHFAPLEKVKEESCFPAVSA
jgi:NADP-dependent 3-hydroxy acid dehydrogenase YdfG